jgi:hypothetical protein
MILRTESVLVVVQICEILRLHAGSTLRDDQIHRRPELSRLGESAGTGPTSTKQQLARWRFKPLEDPTDQTSNLRLVDLVFVGVAFVAVIGVLLLVSGLSRQPKRRGLTGRLRRFHPSVADEARRWLEEQQS